MMVHKFKKIFLNFINIVKSYVYYRNIFNINSIILEILNLRDPVHPVLWHSNTDGNMDDFVFITNDSFRPFLPL